MADQIITGRVLLAHPLLADEATAFVGHLTKSAVRNKIWINTCGHFRSADAQYKYPPDDYLQKGYIPFEITDSENSSEADRILSGIWYDETSRIADLSGSGLADIQSFLGEIIEHEAVSGISVSFDLAHGYPYPEGLLKKCVIRAHAFCTALMAFPCPSRVPAVELNIVKGD